MRSNKGSVYVAAGRICAGQQCCGAAGRGVLACKLQMCRSTGVGLAHQCMLVQPLGCAGLRPGPPPEAQPTCRPCGSQDGSQTCSGCRCSRPRRTAQREGGKAAWYGTASRRRILQPRTWHSLQAVDTGACMHGKQLVVCGSAGSLACAASALANAKRKQQHMHACGHAALTDREALVLGCVVVEALDAAAAGPHLLGQSAVVGPGPAGRTCGGWGPEVALESEHWPARHVACAHRPVSTRKGA